MESSEQPIRLLLVDDEEDFRIAAHKALARRGLEVLEAASGMECLEKLATVRPDIVILDLKMPGMTGAETLARIRRRDELLPVIILTGHGRYEDALVGVRLGVAEFLQKPVDMDRLAAHVLELLARPDDDRLVERSVVELMVSPERYPRLYDDQPVEDAMRALWGAFAAAEEGEAPRQVRSARICDRSERFLGLLRFNDLLHIALPDFLANSPYATCFTGMFLAQCKVIGTRRIRELLPREPVAVEVDAPLMKAVKLMVERRLINLPVLRDSQLVGVLRECDVVYEMLRNLGSLRCGEPESAGGEA